MLCLLGDPAVLRNGVHEPLRLRPKALALTARLALAGGPVERTELARMLFPDAEDPRRELARLPDGRLRRRGLGTALRAEFQSVLETDTLGILERVRCPALIVRGALPWMGGDPWLPDAIWEAQVRACPHAEQFVAWSSNHASLVRDPEDDLVAAIVRFVRSPARRALGAGWLSTV
jgi:pimeloyl-ACP methyl ester carboxylesterase